MLTRCMPEVYFSVGKSWPKLCEISIFDVGNPRVLIFIGDKKQ